MDAQLFLKLCKHPEEFTVAQLQEIELMSDEEINEYQENLELYDGDDLSSFDHLRVLYTLLAIINPLT
jgi:hypothetical protein